MKLICPVCASSNVVDKGNGQESAPIDDDDLLYVALGNEWFDGHVNLIECENGHHFYFPPITSDRD